MRARAAWAASKRGDHQWLRQAAATLFCSLASLIGIMTNPDARVFQGQTGHWNLPFVRADQDIWRIFPQFEDKARLMMCGVIGGKCVVDAAYDVQSDVRAISTDKKALCNLIPANVHAAAPRTESKFTWEMFSGEKRKSKPEWLLTNSSTCSLLFFNWRRAALLQDNKPCIWHNINSWGCPNIGYFERYGDARSILIKNKSPSPQTYLIYSYPSSLAGNQCLSGHIGGLFGDIDECLVSFDQNFVLLASRFHFIQLPLHDRQLIVENTSSDYTSGGDDRRQTNHQNLGISHRSPAGWIDLFIIGYINMVGSIYCFLAGVKRRETIIFSWACAAVLAIISVTLLCLGTNILTSVDSRSENVRISLTRYPPV
jgi:hypothetical protein